MSAPARFHHMDNLRAIAMLLGVLFHAALAYSPLAHPYVTTADRVQSVAVDVGIWFLHLFRMPVFFVVAGFFAAMLVTRRGLVGFFRNRLRRIALPFMIFWPLTYAALSYATLQAAASVQYPSPMLATIQQFSLLPDAPSLPPGTGHLWFLYYLMIFYVLVWSAKSLGLGKLGNWLRGLSPAWLLGVLPLMLVPALAAVSAPNPAPESFLPQFWALGFYGPFFVLGYLLFGHDTLIERLRALAPWLLAASFAAYGAFWFLVQRQSFSGADYSASLPIALLEGCISVWMTCACLVAGRRWLDRSSPMLRYLSDASYWTYLMHLPIVFAIQYWLMDLNLPWGLKFAIVSVATFAICLLSYHVLVRRSFVGELLGSSPRRMAPAGQ